MLSKRDVRSSPSCATCPRSSRARTSTRPTSQFLRGRRIEVRLGPAVRHLRRRRPDRRHPGDDHASSRRCLRVIVAAPDVPRSPAALARARAGRQPPRSGAAAAPPRPGALLLRALPARARAAWRASSRRARCSSPPPTARPPRRRCWPPCLERAGAPVVHNRAGSNMAWGVATALLDAGREPRPARALRGRRGLARRASRERRSSRALLLLSNLFRDQLDRYGELELLADRWAELVGRPGRAGARFVLNADDPLVADLGRERDGRHLLRRRGRLAGAARSCSTRPTRSTAATAAPPTTTRPSTSATWAATAARTAAARGRAPRRGRHARGARRACRGSRGRAAHAAGRAGRSRLPLPGLYNVYNAVAAAATALELGVPLATGRRGARGLRRRVRAGRDDPDRRARRCRSCWSRTPPARTRCCAR